MSLIGGMLVGVGIGLAVYGYQTPTAIVGVVIGAFGMRIVIGTLRRYA